MSVEQRVSRQQREVANRARPLDASTFATLPETFVEVLVNRAARTPDALACRFVEAEAEAQQLTYAELDAAARTIAGTLRDIPAGARCLLLFPPGLDYVTAFFGCLYAGAIAVPVYPPFAATQLQHVQSVLRDAEPDVVLSLGWLRESTQAFDHGDRSPVPVVATDELVPVSSSGWSPHVATSDTPAFLQYTSGSTGTPKGVVVTHGNLVANSQFIADRFGHTRDSRGLIWLPPYHDMGLIGGVLQPIYSGFEVTLMSPLRFLRDPASWLRLISETRATTSGGPDFAYDLCTRKVDDATLAQLDLSSWEVAFTGAERIRAETLRRFAERFSAAGFRGSSFYPCYGLAESTLMVAGVELGGGHRSLLVETQALAEGIAAAPESAAPAIELVSVGDSRARLPGRRRRPRHPQGAARRCGGRDLDLGPLGLRRLLEAGATVRGVRAPGR